MKMTIKELHEKKEELGLFVKGRLDKMEVYKFVNGVGKIYLCKLEDEMNLPIENLDEAVKKWTQMSKAEKEKMIERFYDPYDEDFLSSFKNAENGTVNNFLFEIILSVS